MHKIDQVVLTRHTLEKLQRSVSGLIHSIFNHTINILSDDNTLFTLADKTLKSGPNCLTLKRIQMEALNLNEHDRVEFTKDAIIISDKVIIYLDNIQIIELKNPQINLNQSVLDNIQHIKNQPCYKECESLIDSNVFYGAV